MKNILLFLGISFLVFVILWIIFAIILYVIYLMDISFNEDVYSYDKEKLEKYNDESKRIFLFELGYSAKEILINWLYFLIGFFIMFGIICLIKV